MTSLHARDEVTVDSVRFCRCHLRFSEAELSRDFPSCHRRGSYVK